MAIEAGRHPILESIHNDFVVRNDLFSIGLLTQDYTLCHICEPWLYSLLMKLKLPNIRANTFSFQPNNIFLSEASNMVLIEGPNM